MKEDVPESSEREVMKEDVGDDASSSSGSSSVMREDYLSIGSRSSVEHSEGYWERQMEANRTSVLAFLLTDGDRETYASWVRDMPEDSEKTLPPYRIVKYPELLDKAWGWERLVPYDGSVDMPTYANYLKIYYKHNNLGYIVTGDQNPDEWPLQNDAPQGGQICTGKGLSAVAEICFIKEAYLICELLRRGAKTNDFFIQQSNEIRMCALSLMNCKGQQSKAAAAAMVGVSLEAKMMCAWMKRENMLLDSYDASAPDELEDCRIIRCRTLELMVTIQEDSSFSNLATAVKSDNGVSASETDQGGNGNDKAAPSEAVKPGCLERLNCQDEKIVDTVKAKRRKTKSQMTKNLAVTKKKNRNRQRKSREAEGRVKEQDDYVTGGNYNKAGRTGHH